MKTLSGINSKNGVQKLQDPLSLSSGAKIWMLIRNKIPLNINV